MDGKNGGAYAAEGVPGRFPAIQEFGRLKSEIFLLLFHENRSECPRLYDSTSLSRHGESSGEQVSSVMILNPMVGISL